MVENNEVWMSGVLGFLILIHHLLTERTLGKAAGFTIQTKCSVPHLCKIRAGLSVTRALIIEGAGGYADNTNIAYPSQQSHGPRQDGNTVNNICGASINNAFPGYIIRINGKSRCCHQKISATIYDIIYAPSDSFPVIRHNERMTLVPAKSLPLTTNE